MQIPDGLSTGLTEIFEHDNTPNVTTLLKAIKNNKHHTTGDSSFTVEGLKKKKKLSHHTRDMGSFKIQGLKK